MLRAKLAALTLSRDSGLVLFRKIDSDERGKVGGEREEKSRAGKVLVRGVCPIGLDLWTEGTFQSAKWAQARPVLTCSGKADLAHSHGVAAGDYYGAYGNPTRCMNLLLPSNLRQERAGNDKIQHQKARKASRIYHVFTEN